MLNPSEQAYFDGLVALKRKDYSGASDCFDKAAGFFNGNREFNLIRETTALLLAVRAELLRYEEDRSDDKLEIEEIIPNG